MRLLAVILLLLSIQGFSALTFVEEPSINYNSSGGQWDISFEVSESTDVEVAVVNLDDSTVLRHLAAGVLGSNPPAPLTANSLAQNLVWDGRDDCGRTISPMPAEVGVRVRAGMSVAFDRTVGENPHGFAPVQWGQSGETCALIAADGKLYVYGRTNKNTAMSLRQYDADGNYIKTLFPYPSSLSSSQVSGYGINTWTDGSYSPKISRTYGPYTSATIAGAGSSLPGLSGPGWVAMASVSVNRLMLINTDGSVASSNPQVPLITSPEMPNHYMVTGPGCLVSSPSGSFWLLSGMFESKGDGTAMDTGFWRDGRVYKIDPLTGAASIFIQLDSVPLTLALRQSVIGPAWSYGGLTFAAMHGTAFDDSGHVFVCDRWHQRISVYDTLGNYITGIPLKFPDMVTVNKETGELYALTRNILGYNSAEMKLYRFPGWRNNPSPACSVNVPFSGYLSNVAYLSLNSQGEKPVLWLSCAILGVLAYRDDGDAFTLTQDWLRDYKSNLGFDKILVNRKTDQVYINDGWSGLYQVDDWTAPRVEACSSSAKKPVFATDLAMSLDNELYVQDGGGYSGPINRFTTGGHYLEPLDWANSGKNMLTSYIYGRMHGVGGYGPKGMAVSPDKKVACQYQHTFGAYFVGEFADSGTIDSLQHVDTLIKPSCPRAVGGAMRYDSKGNLYLGVAFKPPAMQTPSGFASDETWFYYVGSIARVPKGVKGRFAADKPESLAIADKFYTVPFGAFSGNCWCRLPTFDIDPYDRLFVPNGVTQKVAVADNNGNLIAEFGRYGNADEQGPGVPMAFPAGAAASENHIYVTDFINTRLVRVKMNFALENMSLPDAGIEASAGKRGPAMAALPNPFSGSGLVSVNLPAAAAIKLSVYDIRGRLVKVLANGRLKAGVHAFTWNAAQAAAGVYVYRLEAEKRLLTSRVILAD